MRHSRHVIILTTAAAIAAAVVIFVYSSFDPSASALFPKCVIKSLTGYDCPGCGSQRAIHSLLNGDLMQAWHYNALLVASLPLIAVLLAAAAMRTRFPRFYAAVNSRQVIIAVAVIVIIWWILRNTPLIQP